MVSLASSTGEQAELTLEAWALVQAPRSQLSWPSSMDCTTETRQGPWPSRGTGRWGWGQWKIKSIPFLPQAEQSCSSMYILSGEGL